MLTKYGNSGKKNASNKCLFASLYLKKLTVRTKFSLYKFIFHRFAPYSCKTLHYTEVDEKLKEIFNIITQHENIDIKNPERGRI